MNYADWYTDRMDIHRVTPVRDGALTRHERVQVAENIPCRIYRSGVHGPRMQPTAAYTESTDDKLACANTVDVRPGDELLVLGEAGQGLALVKNDVFLAMAEKILAAPASSTGERDFADEVQRAQTPEAET